MYITITGELGSGKSTVAKRIHQNYGFVLYSTGTMQREIAKEKGITTLELNLQMANDIHNIYDKLIDDKTVAISKENVGKDVIFDSRMAWHFVEQSFKVYVTVDRYVAAERVIKDDRGREEHYQTIEEAVAGLLKRKQVEDSRFSEMYHVNTTDFRNYDLVLDSSDISPEQMADLILENARNHQGGKQVFLSPRRLYPSKLVQNQDFKEDPSSMVDVVFYKGYYYILNGYSMIRAKLQKKDSLVQVNLLKTDEQNLVEKYHQPVTDLISFDKALFQDWEARHAIKFNSYPV